MTLPALPRTPLALAAVTVLAALLGACRAERVATTGSLAPVDYRARHPIALTDGTRSLDVFPTGMGHLDPRQSADVDAFLLEFRRYGRGRLVVDVPRGVSPAAGASVERTVASIRRLGAEGGVPPEAVVMTGYAVAAPRLAAPIRLSFQRMEAKVTSQCGLWPRDLGVSDPAYSLSNEPSWNLGCATQSNVASQVADPVDLVRGRTEGRIDTVRRVKGITDLRDGKDPSTTWRQDGQASVKTQLGN
ncbi:CpaD family pilus assembly protein [Methylobacterium durans]|uniref:Pilus assembly protein CpaD n=1 Tax=Methylobacterium durans TaxID=2202825 RepID=A0A2U8WDG7_9HYPH|nr:CpaD family pilus assembly protein [Methylobacterium durans]AWN44244.1 pilus assembly protein CpaD [Methylobacterium durans]